MNGKSKHVATLSDKISGLKFMQRAKAIVEKAEFKQAGESSKLTLNGTDAYKESEEGPIEGPRIGELAANDNEEHWVLPARDAERILKGKASSESSHVSLEPGWNAWLLEADGIDLVGGDDGSTRKLYGSWSKKSRKRDRDSRAPSSGKATKGRVDSRSGATESSDETGSSGSDSDIASKDLKSSGFIKPGSLPNKNKKNEDEKGRKTRSKKRKQDSNHERGTGNNSRKKKDRKVSETPLLSGFSNLK